MKTAINYSELTGKEYTRESVTTHEGAYLAELVELAPAPTAVVEIGSWIGVSTIYLARAVKQNGGCVITVDPHEKTILHRRQGVVDTESLLRENLRRFGVEDVTQVIRATSLGALEKWREVIDFLFLDGSHYFRSVREDFFGWSPWLHAGGILAFHDYPTRSGVRRVVDEIVRPSGLWEELGRVQKLVAFRRKMHV